MNSKKLSHSFVIIYNNWRNCSGILLYLTFIKERYFIFLKAGEIKQVKHTYLSVNRVIGEGWREVTACLKSNQNTGQNGFNTTIKGFRGGDSEEDHL